jgi:hypothetical protein
MPLEDIVQLSNVLGTNAWLCVPHTASDEWVLNFARLIKTTLRPDVKIYIEWSNEVWNRGFDVYAYAVAQVGVCACVCVCVRARLLSKHMQCSSYIC